MLLSKIHLLPPDLGEPWQPYQHAASAAQPTAERIEAAGLFWYDPPWHFVPPSAARTIAAAIDALGIPVGLLGRDVGVEDAGELMLRNMLVPYRPERYGVQWGDLRSGRYLDVRLARVQDPSGRYAYAHGQLARWLGVDAGDSSNDFGARSRLIPAPGWPADVPRLDLLHRKFAQLRAIGGEARCAVSLPPYRVVEQWPTILRSCPDIVILRMDDADEFQDADLAVRVDQAVRLVQQHAAATELWLVPPNRPEPEDCVKLFALGVARIAIDWWCQPLISSAAAGQSSPAHSGEVDACVAQATELVLPLVTRIEGLLESCGAASPTEVPRNRLGTLDPEVADRLAISLQ